MPKNRPAGLPKFFQFPSAHYVYEVIDWHEMEGGWVLAIVYEIDSKEAPRYMESRRQNPNPHRSMWYSHNNNWGFYRIVSFIPEEGIGGRMVQNFDNIYMSASVSFTTAEKGFMERAKKGKPIKTIASNTIHILEGVEKMATKAQFLKLGELQRDAPERAMLEAQWVMNGSGIMSGVIEHLGDLNHRMNDRGTWRLAGYADVRKKVSSCFIALTHKYGFLKEWHEQMRDTAEIKKVDFEELMAKTYAALLKYAEAHAALPVYNEAHTIARDICVALGEVRIEDAVAGVASLIPHLSSVETWVAFARQNCSEV